MNEVECGSYEEMIFATGCVFSNRQRGVICKNRNNCEKCGWNPEVETARIEKIRSERLKEET